MKKIVPVMVLMMAAGLVGCATTGPTNNLMNSSQTTPANVSAGILATNKINDSMSNTDRAKLQQLVATAGNQQTVRWQGSGGNQYTFISQQVFVNDEGQACRQYRFNALINDVFYHAKRQMQATACRNDDGTWQLISIQQPTS